MTIYALRLLIAIALISVSVFAVIPVAEADPPVVRAVLFHTETCPFCKEVIDDVLPPIQEKYGHQLELLMLETFEPANARLLYAAQDAFALPPERQGVPTLIIGDTILVGPDEIRSGLTAAIDRYVVAGGVDYPDLPGLAALIGSADATQTAPPRGAALRDWIANGLAIAVLAGMVLSLVYLGFAGMGAIRRPGAGLQSEGKAWQRWGIPVLALIGLATASYLTWVKLAHARPVCGPLGNCDLVQNSPYAQLGEIPVALLGALAYVGILALWTWGEVGRGVLADLAPLGLFALSLTGTLFSVYLTFLEPFVIRAICPWCLVSAVTITVICLLAAGAVFGAIGQGEGVRALDR